ncbi:putative oxidoreductase YcjS [Roseisalinus antarcticus]|uniref:Putative oxidoreductase YcjS n=1 Tax=Roseisalinus antarcticus TaxID=254357 RepID=A0A1Y5SJK6_9RHOB|nr:putative oxidoreductase YcjS [Roseisalinus antarcticus]
MIRVGLIGAGMIGGWHARIVAEGASALAAVCDLDMARASALADRYGAAAFDDPAAFFASGLDAVIIATPEAAHAGNVAMAAEQGCAVMIEKPVAPDLATMREIIAVAEAAGITAMAAHVERFETGSAQLQSAVAEGVCGRVASILARRQFGPGEVGRFAGSSSTLRILGIHDFDLVRWVHPGAIASVHAMAGRGALHAAHGMDDHVITTIGFEDGAVACVESAWTLPPAYARFDSPEGWQAAGNNRLDVYGAKGFVSNDMSLRNQQLVAFDAAEGFRAAGIRHQPVVHGRVQGALRAEVEHFLDCVASGAAPIVGLGDALRSVALLEAAEAALASGVPQVPVL